MEIGILVPQMHEETKEKEYKNAGENDGGDWLILLECMILYNAFVHE